MKPVPSTFLKKLLYITLAQAGVLLLVFSLVLPYFYIPVFLLLLAFVSAFTWFSFKWLVNTDPNEFGKFVRKIMVVTIVRMFVYILLTILYALLLKKDLLIFIVVFGTMYLIYIFLEVYELIWGSGRLTVNKK